MRRFLAFIFLVLIIHPAVNIQAQQSSSICPSLQSLLTNQTTPYDLGVSGGVLQPNESQTATLEGYAHVWSFNFARERNTADAPIETPIIITLDSAESDNLEIALFNGMGQPADINGISGYRPIIAGETHTYIINQDGFFSLVIRRQDLTNTSPVTYRFTPSFSGGGEINLPTLRDETLSVPQSAPPQLQSGMSIITVNNTQIYTQPGSASGVGSQNGARTQIFLGRNANILIDNWADNIMLIGGDLIATGAERTFYLQGYGYDFPLLDGTLLNITDANGTRWRLDWTALSGVWITQDCAGLKLKDGRFFYGTFNASPRSVQFQGTLDNFTIALNDQQVTLDWSVIESSISLENRTFSFDLKDDHELVLESSNIALTTADNQLNIALEDRDAAIALDWTNMGRFALEADTITLDFTDGIRTSTTRTAENLTSLEALDDVIHIAYQTGEERLMLPASESFVEIITPAGLPAYDARFLPGDAGYFPRGQNNTGGECYPINTLQSVANCPSNGDINPANSNLWYGITDLIAYGGDLDLMLTRSYNSRWANIDGSFGYGWTTPYLLDYNVAYNSLTNSRPITPETMQTYPVSLDLTYAPYGIVTYITGSGSRHQFVHPQDHFTSGEMTSLTMPGWTLSRESVRAGWILTLPDGLTYTFDRAGRLKSYGYAGQQITIDYPGTFLNGVVDNPDPIIITDSADDRRLELYFNADHRISRAILRDVTARFDDVTCDNIACFEVGYIYDPSGNLISAQYPDGETALYVYDNLHRIVSHDDPRAPISRNMTYTYGENNALTAQVTGELTWRTIATSVNDREQRRIDVTDQWGNLSTYTYHYIVGAVKTNENAFTLISQTSPLNGTSDFESLPISYEWGNGLLNRVQARTVRENIGRNSVTFTYTSAGQITRIRGGYPEFNATYNTASLPEALTFGDGSTEQFTYDDQGRIATWTDQYGAEYAYTWNNANQLTRVNDTSYTYNALGQITGVDDVTFDYDAFGRLIHVDDPRTGVYAIAYIGNQISVTDATGTVTTSIFDAQGNLIERIISMMDGTPYRHSRYEYDSLHRLTAEINLLDEQELATTYAYNTTLQLSGEGSPTEIRGYTITVTDAYGRIERYTYDARERLRQVVDLNGHITRYEYAPDSVNGLRITERQIINNRITQETIYQFNLEWQLINVQRGEAQWKFTPYFETSRPQFLEAQRAGIASMEWRNYADGRATTVSINQTMPQLPSRTESPDYGLSAAYDSQGRPLSMTDGEGNIFYATYCTDRTYYSETPITCDEVIGYHHAVTYDAAGRLTQVSTPDGTRDYVYTPQPDMWQVDVTFSSGESWILTYNGMGELISWVDENGFATTYTYDMLGRLTRIQAPVPDASFTYEYNAANLLTLAQDDLGRGERYDYDALGRITVQQNIRNANATIYGYNADGRLTTIISPLGNTTAFVYDDIGRLIRMVEPTGSIYEFIWDDAGNRLQVNDPRGNTTAYAYDGLGSLWRIDDAAERTHEIHYNAAGHIISWLQSNNARRMDITPAEEAGFTITAGEWSQNWMINPQVTQIGGISLEYDLLGRLSNIGRDTLEYGQGTLTFGEDTFAFDSLNRHTDDYAYGTVRGSDLQVTSDNAIITYTEGDESARPPSTTVNQSGRMTTYTYTPEGLLSEVNRQVCMDTNQLIDDPFNLATCQRETPEQIWRTTERVVYDALGRPLRYIDQEQNIRTYGYDDAGNLSVYQDLDGKTFDYTYDVLNRLESITAPTGTRLLLAYDALDRVIGVCLSRGEASTTYAECANNGTILSTYTYESAFESPTPPDVLADDVVQNGFIYDERGLLTSIEGVLDIEYLTTPEGRVLVVQIERSDGELIQLQMNRRGDTENITYFNSNLLNDFVLDPIGTIQRQSIIGDTIYFEAQADGYIIVTGYDNDNRPVTMRVNDRASGTLLYLLTFTYNNAGQRITETRQYADGTQITITYRYNDVRQLIERRVSNNRHDAVGMPGIWLMLGSVWLIPLRRRRWLAIVLTGVVIALALSITLAQNMDDATVYTYEYDENGNLTTIRADDALCTVYTYDAQNRLSSVGDSTGRTVQRYTYDNQNRLTRIGEAELTYIDGRLLRVANDDESRVYGILDENSPAFYQQSGEAITWLYHDGRNQILSTNLQEGLWVFDPLGRYLPLTPSIVDDPCAVASMPAAFNQIAPIESLGMIWDGNLYFDNGRAYLPEIGQYLQADPQGPDVYGAIYSYPSRTIAPPIRDRLPAYAEGIYRLRDALDILSISDHLTPPQISYDGAFTLDGAPYQRDQYAQLANLLDLPAWLMTNYNLPSARTDATGTLRMMPDNAPHGWNTPISSTANALFDDPWLPQIASPLDRLNGLTALTQPRQFALRTYEPFAWVAGLPTLSTGVNYPEFGATPREVMVYLPDALHQPESAAEIIDSILALQALPTMTDSAWREAILAEALPQQPIQPPQSVEAWLSQWFSTNTLGISPE